MKSHFKHDIQITSFTLTEGRDRVVVRFTTTYAIIAYHH